MGAPSVAGRVGHRVSYDAADGLIAIEDRLGNSIDYELDVMGNRVGEWVTDPNGALKRELQRVYDGFNRLQKDLGALGQATQYEYDANNTVTKVTDPLNRITTHTYDQLNRLKDSTTAAGTTVYTYDAKAA